MIFIGSKLILDDSAHIPTTGMLIFVEKNLKAHPNIEGGNGGTKVPGPGARNFLGDFKISRKCKNCEKKVGGGCIGGPSRISRGPEKISRGPGKISRGPGRCSWGPARYQDISRHEFKNKLQ